MNFDNYDDFCYIKCRYIIDFLDRDPRLSKIIDEILLEDLDVYIYLCVRVGMNHNNVCYITIDFFGNYMWFEWYGDITDFKPWIDRSHNESTVEDQVIFLEEFFNFVEIITRTKGGSIRRDDFIKKYDLR